MGILLLSESMAGLEEADAGWKEREISSFFQSIADRWIRILFPFTFQNLHCNGIRGTRSQDVTFQHEDSISSIRDKDFDAPTSLGYESASFQLDRSQRSQD